MIDAQAGIGLLLLGLSAAGLAAIRMRTAGAAPWLWVIAVALAAAGVAAAIGSARLAAIDGGAFPGESGRPATAAGTVAAVPRRSRGEVRVELQTANGRLLAVVPEPVPDLPVGSGVRAAGILGEPDPFLAAQLRRRGIIRVLSAERLLPTGSWRGGLDGALDRVRIRAATALERGMRAPEAALARGFVLGEDDRIDSRTIDDFKRSGLAHLLAVSGQNVILLALLAMPLLALAGLSLRARLLCVLALIAIYVPVAGAGPSIQRAGAMGAAGVIAALAGRPRSRAYAVLLAATATLTLNPRAAAEIGWQLSFAAVIGIMLASRRLAALLPGGRERGWKGALADGSAMSIAATLATAPLMAHHFEQVSIAALPANLLALPAVAPAMWLGMLSAAAGQLPLGMSAWLIVALNAVNQLLLAYIEQVARWFAEPGWAVAAVRLATPPAVLAAYAVLLAGGWLLIQALERRRGLRPGRAADGPKGAGSIPLRRAALTAVLLVCALLALGPGGGGPDPEAGPAREALRLSVLDVGQGDAILLQPPRGGAVLVDGGPPGADLRGLLAERGVESLSAAILTHDQRDHAGGLLELFGRIPVSRLLYGAAGQQLLGAAAAAGIEAVPVFEGSELRFGELRLEALWPPVAATAAADADPNRGSLVLLAEWRHFSVLLSGDAEAEAVQIEPTPVDVLKVAHHGSADAGLDRLLDLAVPDLALISVGEDNPYGHPAAETLAALRDHELRTLRTDLQGTIEVTATPGGWRVANAD